MIDFLRWLSKFTFTSLIGLSSISSISFFMVYRKSSWPSMALLAILYLITISFFQFYRVSV